MLLYRLAIQILRLGLWCAAALGHRKAKAAWRGRKGWHSRLEQAELHARKNGRTGPWIHFHCASLGEFEQGAPVIRLWRKQHPEAPILLTFFSPSGIEGVTETGADHVDYLPFDTPLSALKFSKALDISDTVFVKYELWPELMRALHRNNTRLHLVAARFDVGRHPLNKWGRLIRKHMGLLSTLQVQDLQSAQALRTFGFEAQVTGDPRVDRVFSATQDPIPGPIQERLKRIHEWKERQKLLVIGSAWPAEWQALRDILDTAHGWVVLWAPHDIDHPDIGHWASHKHTDYLSSWTGHTPGPGTYKTFDNVPGNPDMLIADEMGLLRFVYGMADVAVVGGGWGRGVHNVLEPAAFGIPVLCGPNVTGFREIEALKQSGGLKVCATADDLAKQCGLWMESKEAREEAGQSAAAWVVNQRGSALRIVSALQSCQNAEATA